MKIKGWVAGSAACLVLAGLLVAEFQRPLNSDSAWLLHLAGRVAQGDRLYHDLIEINPPLVVWLQLPIVFLSERLGLDPATSLRIAVLIWIGGCLTLSDRILRSTPLRGKDRLWILLAAVMVTLVWTRAHFAEREHLALVALLPYLFATAVVAQGRALPTTLRIGVGCVAALGFTIKPHFLLVWLLCLLYTGWRRRRAARWIVGPENLFILGFVLLYGLAVLVFAPEYLSLVSRLAPLYGDFARKDLASLVFDSAEALCAIAALLSYAILRPSLRVCELGDVLALATVAFLAAVLIQGKGFSYHYYPVSGSTLVLAAVVLAGRDGPRARAAEKVGELTLTLLLLLATLSGLGWSLSQLWRQEPLYLRQEQMARYIRAHAADGSVLRLGYEDNFPLIDMAGARWSMRFPTLWFVQAAYARQLAAGSEPEYRPPARMEAAERWCFEAVVEDFIRFRPGLLMVIRPNPPRVAGDVTRLNYLSYFSQDPRFATELRRYRAAGVVGGYAVFQRGR